MQFYRKKSQLINYFIKVSLILGGGGEGGKLCALET